MPEPPRAVLFDFGGVIAEEGFHQGLRALAARNGLDETRVLQACHDAIYGSGFIIGRGGEADFWRALRAHISFRESDDEVRADVLARFRLRPHMLQLVHDLRARNIRCALLSDQIDWLDRLDARDHFFREFDRLYISYRLGKGKADASLFDDVVADLGVHPREALLVDDNAGNIERAVSRGLIAWLFTDEDACLARLAPLFSGQREISV
ncbi:MAG: HAD family phosphatase [Gammaproteobacteria bacterium]|nr:MAG: HAD family phosphatase [Gammaproteobacteria bacterium]